MLMHRAQPEIIMDKARRSLQVYFLELNVCKWLTISRHLYHKTVNLPVVIQCMAQFLKLRWEELEAANLPTVISWYQVTERMQLAAKLSVHMLNHYCHHRVKRQMNQNHATLLIIIHQPVEAHSSCPSGNHLTMHWIPAPVVINITHTPPSNNLHNRRQCNINFKLKRNASPIICDTKQWHLVNTLKS